MFLLLALLTVVLPGLAAGASLADRWIKGLKEVDQELRTQRWAEAGKQARRVTHEMVNDAGRDKDVAYSLAVASVFRAIAEEGAGNDDEAAWYWDTALNLVPEIYKTDLTPYGAPAAALKERRLRIGPLVTGEGLETPDGQSIPFDKVERPRIVQQVRPDYPDALVQLGAPGRVVVETVIGIDGRPRQPRVLEAQGGGPAMKYAALEAVGQWRFEPARLEGKPVKVYYILTVNFQLRYRR
jgi:TonB family protein